MGGGVGRVYYWASLMVELGGVVVIVVGVAVVVLA